MPPPFKVASGGIRGNIPVGYGALPAQMVLHLKRKLRLCLTWIHAHYYY